MSCEPLMNWVILIQGLNAIAGARLYDDEVQIDPYLAPKRPGISLVPPATSWSNQTETRSFSWLPACVFRCCLPLLERPSAGSTNLRKC